MVVFFFFQAEDGIRDHCVTGVQTCALPISSRTEYPALTLVTFMHALVRDSLSAAKQVAQLLGSRLPGGGLDPSTWSLELQGCLPTEFGRDLLAAARLEANGTWAMAVERWPDDASWLGNDFPEEVWKFASLLQEASKPKPQDALLREYSRQAARKLRHLSEVQRFQAVFNAQDRWLMMQAIVCVIPTLPDDATLAWIEREMSQASWRTRSFVLEHLIHLASVDAARTAQIYRQAVGLSEVNGRPTLDAKLWCGVFDHQAIEWSLAGGDGHRSLLREHPTEFIPPALELTEALWHIKREEPGTSHGETLEWMKQFDAHWPDLDSEDSRRAKQLKLDDLIDDAPDWSYWRTLPMQDEHERCLRSIHECAEDQLKRSAATFLTKMAPQLKSSRLASVQSILLDLLLANIHEQGFLALLGQCLMDGRLYQVSGLNYWIEQGLTVAWTSLDSLARVKVLDNITSLRNSSHCDGERCEKQLLARLPTQDLPEALRELRPDDGDPDYRPCSQPKCLGVDLGAQLIPVQGAEGEDAVERE